MENCQCVNSKKLMTSAFNQIERSYPSLSSWVTRAGPFGDVRIGIRGNGDSRAKRALFRFKIQRGSISVGISRAFWRQILGDNFNSNQLSDYIKDRWPVLKQDMQLEGKDKCGLRFKLTDIENADKWTAFEAIIGLGVNHA